ncbi:MAG TPA: CBS domain-containing protein [Lachnoclostridium phytofermentans]|uniref:CBS domain-containing protein n=1 Tax=Lachnoclostridium phytofermentans TaxID=66219 RepID=A0A3D2X2U4_9FIRM|nr:CBS domain-containing protein [Lachnoclostridium sp.]HCL01460.1 CBS domain-containing protein [Lachnoclostridium phytofermentans]
MNILFFLTPKIEVAYIFDTFTVRQALETLRERGYSAIPMIDKNGKYIGTVTEGDLLWYVLEHREEDPENFNKVKIKQIVRRKNHCAVGADKKIEELVDLVKNQNFVPVLDDDDRFIGIVTRKAIMQYCTEAMIPNSLKAKQ